MCGLKKIAKFGGLGLAGALGGLPGLGAAGLVGKLFKGKKKPNPAEGTPEYQSALAQGAGRKRALKTAAAVVAANAEAQQRAGMKTGV